MYEPKFNYSDKLVANLVKLENNRTIVQTLDLPYEVRSKLSLKAKAINLFHFAHMIDVDLTLKDSERMLLGTNLNIENIEKKTLLMNFRNALEFNSSSDASNFPEFDKALLMELNRIILLNWKETWDAKYRDFNERLDTRFDVFGSTRDQTILGKDLNSSMEDFVEWYKYQIPVLTPIIRIGITFFRFVQISPFIAGNTFTLMALLDGLLIKNQFSSKISMSIVKNIDTNKEQYQKAFELSLRNHELTVFLETFVELMAKELIESRENINEFITSEEKAKKQPFLDLNKRQLKALKYLQKVRTIQREDYCHMMEVSTMTAFRDLNDLVRKKLIKTEGRGRGTKYRLSSM